MKKMKQFAVQVMMVFAFMAFYPFFQPVGFPEKKAPVEMSM